MNDTVHVAVPLPASVGQEHYKDARSHRYLVERARSQRGNLGYAVGFVGLAAAGCMAFAIAAMMPLKTIEPYALEINHLDGYIGPARVLADAPKMFDENQKRGQVFEYITAREAYDPHKDRLNYDRVRFMSDADVFIPYDKWVNTRDAPKRRLGMTGSINVPHEKIWLSEPLTTDNGTTSYKLRFEKTEMLNAAATQPQLCNGSISLRFNHELLLPHKGDVFLNPMGMQVLSYDGSDCHFTGDNK